MEKDLFNVKEFRQEEIPKWKCPTCGIGVLEVAITREMKKPSIYIYETNYTKEAIKQDEYTPDWDKDKFYGYLLCSNCKEKVTICGNTSSVEYISKDKFYYYDMLKPEYFNPPLRIININTNCPITVKDLIEDSFKLFWLDLSSCVNKIRITIEELLNIKGIKKTELDRHGKRIPLSLHGRIKLFKVKNEKIALRLMALKWIGNLGSHHGEITKEHILQAYEILESVIDDLYDDKDKRINKSVKSLIKSKGRKV